MLQREAPAAAAGVAGVAEGKGRWGSPQGVKKGGQQAGGRGRGGGGGRGQKGGRGGGRCGGAACSWTINL